jgi:hypothetical protein
MAAKERFSISMDPSVRAGIKAHAEALDLDVSAYVTAAVLRQMEEDAAIRRRFAAVDAGIAATESLPEPADGTVDFDEAELAAARSGMAQALAPSAPGTRHEAA